MFLPSPNQHYLEPPFYTAESEATQFYGAGQEKGFSLNYQGLFDTKLYNSRSSESSSLRDDTASNRSINDMTDSEVRRLEDKISHVDQMSQARLDQAMAEINGKISLILERTDSIKGDISASRQSENQHFQWLAGLIIASVLTTILAIGGFAYSAKSLWASGYSSGQTDRPTPSVVH